MSLLATFKRQETRRSQRGDVLIESMIGLALMGLIGMGITHVTSKISVAQRDMAMQDIAISKMRYYVIQNGADHDLCTTAPNLRLPAENETQLQTEVHGCAPIVATVSGTTIANAKTPVMMSVVSPSIGEMRVGGSATTL